MKASRCRMISITPRCRDLSNEAKQKLQTHRPRTIGHASRIDGMTPAALTLLVAHVKRGRGKTRVIMSGQGALERAKPIKNVALFCSRLFHVKRKNASRRSLICSWSGKTNSTSWQNRHFLWFGPGTSPIRSSFIDHAPNAKVWADFGTGAGFPRIPIACALAGTAREFIFISLKALAKRPIFCARS